MARATFSCHCKNSKIFLLLIMTGERIVCIYFCSTTKNPEDSKYAVFISPGYENLTTGLDRETALRTARELFEEDGNTVVFDHSERGHVRIASHYPDKVKQMADYWRPLNLKVKDLVWEELL